MIYDADENVIKLFTKTEKQHNLIAKMRPKSYQNLSLGRKNLIFSGGKAYQTFALSKK